MDNSNIVITGFMATGKTTIGRLLADHLGYEFVDTNDLVQTRYGQTMAEIFRDKGEAACHEVEDKIAKELTQSTELVIATSGRMMLNSNNSAISNIKGRVFCLVATPQEILARVAHDKTVQRPLLDVSNPFEWVVELMQEREEEYQRFPQIVTSGKTPEEVAAVLAGIIRAAPDLHFTITAANAHYDYFVGTGLLSYVSALAGIQGPVAIITDNNVGELFVANCGAVDTVVEIPSGAENKTLSTVRGIYDQLIEANFDRSGTIIALGGGVISELAGFVAATYMRGVDCVQCPTSLLAMVDTCIGGKASLDLPQGQNLIGAFKQPKAVIADVTTLQQLPVREFASGMAEVIKHGLIADPGLLAMVQNGDWTFNSSERPALADLQALVSRAVEIKIQAVQKDPFDRGHRTVLNLGHSFAHAIEKNSAHSIRHGEAVAMGVIAAINLSAKLGHCPAALQGQVEEMLTDVYLPVRIPGDVSPEQLLKAMWHDKKNVAGRLRLVLIRETGDVFVNDDVPEEAVLGTLKEVCEMTCL